MQRKEAKRRALETLKNRWGEAIVVSLLYSIILKNQGFIKILLEKQK